MWALNQIESWLQKNWCFWTVVWRRLLKVPWTARRSNQSILKEISPEYSLEGLMLKLKLQYFGHLMQKTDLSENPWCWERLKAGGEEDDRGWDDRWLNGNEFEQALEVGDGQGGLARCSPWGRKGRTWLINWTEAWPKFRPTEIKWNTKYLLQF